MSKSANNRGSLTIVGSGIQAVGQITLETKQAIEDADKVLYAVSDPVSEIWIKKTNPNSESLMDCFVEGKYRPDIYKEIVNRTMTYVREGLNVCVVYYGHPGVFVDPSRKSIMQARAEGFNARMLPGISAEDCLFADLGVDPGTHGCQSFEATSFLLRKPKFDTLTHLILWQIGSIGDFKHNPTNINKSGLVTLGNFLEKYYDRNHEVIVYEAAQFDMSEASIQRLPLSRLAIDGQINRSKILYIPPKRLGSIDFGMANKLGLRQQFSPVNFRFSMKKLLRLESNDK